MDQDTVRRLDSIVENDIARGFRICSVPPEITKALADEGITAPTHVRLSRINPARRRDINEAVYRRYQKDLRDPDILSNAQITTLAERRGEWDATMQKRMDELQDRSTRDMAKLWGEGFDPNNPTWGRDMVACVDKLRASMDAATKSDEEKREFFDVLDRWVAFRKSRLEEPRYVAAAAAQGLPQYSPDRDQSWLFSSCAKVEDVDLINEIEELRDKQHRLITLNEERLELAALQLRHAKLFADSAESRRDSTEELAQLYFTCERCAADGAPQGRLAPSFDELWAFPDAAVRWLLFESFFFHNDIPDAARDYLQAFGGFLPAARGSSENGPSAGSPAPQSSSPAIADAEATDADSTASPVATSSMTAS